VLSLRRDLRGSHHFHNYSGVINSVDLVLSEMVVTLDGATKLLQVDELKGAVLGQKATARYVVSNTVNAPTATLQFGAGVDLSGFVVGGRFNCALPRYPGSFIPDPTAAFSLTSQRGVLGQTISAGTIVPTVTMQDASGIPNANGFVVFNFGKSNQEALIKYFGRPNNTTLFIDPVYTFTKAHAVGELVNVIVTPYRKPRANGADHSVYLVGITAARLLAQQIVESITAAGIVINWNIVGPKIDC
jgi:hypothetical protein